LIIEFFNFCIFEMLNLIKLLEKLNNNYILFNSFYIRVPLFTFFEYEKWLKKEIVSTNDFKKLLKNKAFKEALFLASPELMIQLDKFEKGTLKDKNKIERLKYSILKYFTRSTTRCTPFGLFASCALGSFGSETNIMVSSDKKRFTKFDTTFLTQLFQELLKHNCIKENVLFYPNTSIYNIGDHYRYIEYNIKNKKRSYTIEGVKFSKYLAKILDNAKGGTTILSLISLLVDNEITRSEAKDYINKLIDSQILVSELEINVTGKDYFTFLLHRIQKIPKAVSLYNQLKQLQDGLLTIDSNDVNNLTNYEPIIAKAKTLVSELDTKYLFQTDSFYNLKNNSLNKNIQTQLNKALILFNKITIPFTNENLETFKRKFLNRFGESELPLNLLLDTETGIGYGNQRDEGGSLLSNLITPITKKRYERNIWTDADNILQQKLVEATKKNACQINLTFEDFKSLPLNWNNLPDTFSSIIEVYKTNNQEQVFIKNVGGSSAVNLLGRFSNGDKNLTDHINAIITTEEKINNNKILAEIIHLPEARTGNILQRTNFRTYEIVYLGKSNTATKYQIPLEDILVSVKNNRVVLRSKRFNKEILPRLGNAHNFTTNPLPIYQFLCELQTQNKRSSIGFSWNPILEKHSFLPRVVFENCIFSKARWKIKINNFKKLFEKQQILLEIKIWQQKLMIPDYVELVDGDNKLLICLTNLTSVKMLLSTVKNRNEFVLEEFLFSNDEYVKDDNNHSFCNQVIVSFYNNQKLKKKQYEK